MPDVRQSRKDARDNLAYRGIIGLNFSPICEGKLYGMYRNLTAKLVASTALLMAGAIALFGTAGTTTTNAEAQRGGAAIYAQNCARCHGVDGRAQTRKGRETDAVDFTSDDWSPDAAHDARIVTNGKRSMPAFGRRLSQAQINAVVQYIRRFKR